MDVKRLYEHYHKTVENQNLVISSLKEEANKSKLENEQLTLEMMKQVKENARMSKEYEMKIKEMEKEVLKGYNKANELFQENLVLIEEKRVRNELKELMKKSK